MNMKQIFKMTALATMMAACNVHENNNESAFVTSDPEEAKRIAQNDSIAYAHRDSVERDMRRRADSTARAKKMAELQSFVNMMANGYENGWVSSPVSYAVKGEPQFSVVHFDSAGIQASVLLDRNASYDLLMQRLGKNKAGENPEYELINAEFKELTCSDTPKSVAEITLHRLDGKAQTPDRSNTTLTNYMELMLYKQYGNIISPESFQCKTTVYYERYPSYAIIEDKNNKFRTSIADALDAVSHYKNTHDVSIKSILREEVELGLGNEREKSNAYVIKLESSKP